MDIAEAIAEIQQPRSRYQIVHFVLGQHDPPEMQFYQLIQEIQSTCHAIRVAELGVKKQKIEIARLLETGDELDAVEAEEKQVGLEYTEVLMIGSQRELAVMMDIFNASDHFTRDEIEHAEPDYWAKRLSRQTNLQIMSGGLQWAQLDAMHQAGMLEDLIKAQEKQITEQARLELAQ